MNRKRKTAIVALLSVFAATATLAACSTVKNITEVPTDKDYGYDDPERVYAQPDEGFVIDGKADEAAYQNAKWAYLKNQNGTDTVDLAMTSFFGEKGMYFVYDVTESTPIYVNHDRASYINSGIEMYFAPNGVTSMNNDHVYEIDLEADGEVTFKKTSGYSGSWTDVGTTDDIMAYAASAPKGGEINSGECFGYTLEFFIPWDYIEFLGMSPESIGNEAVNVNPVHITSYNYDGTDHDIDRYWYSFATQLGGDGWNDVGQYFKFDKDGVVGTVPVTMEEGVHCTLTGADTVIPGLPATVTVTPEAGYAVSSVTCNGNECIKLVNYNEDGSATYTAVGADGGLTFSASAEAVTEGNKNLTGKINLRKAGGDTLEGLSASYMDTDGEHTLPLGADGSFALNDLPQGYYKITAEKNGYGKVTRCIYLNRNIETQIDLEYGTFSTVEGTCWDISNANDGILTKRSGRGIILSKNSYETVYTEANFRYDESFANSGNGDDKEQRAGIRMKFSGGKSWSVTLVRSGESYIVMYAQHNKTDFIFGWKGVHTMTAKEIAKYKSGAGISLGILRTGTTAYLYLDGELVHTETGLAEEGIKADETVQIGFEAFYFNPSPQEVRYTIKDENADEVTLVAEKQEGGTVGMEDAYRIGKDVILVLNKTNADYVLLSLLVNGKEMSGSVVDNEGVDILTLEGNMSRTLNVEVVYGEPREITAHIAVDGAWKANGIGFTFTNAADNTVVKTATVVNGKMTIENMLQGCWHVSANVFGKNVGLGDYSVISEEEKQLDLENVFVNGKKLDPSVIGLATGSFVYHSAIDEDYSIRIDEAGDAYLAAKLRLGAEDKAKLLKGGEVSFGMYMTVKDADGKETTHWTDFWIKNAGNDNLLSIRTDFGWAEDFCKPFTTNVNTEKYTKALFGDGLTVVLRYKAATGVMETYFGENDFSVKYLRDWNDSAHLFPANGTVVQAGFRDNLTWGDTSVAVEVEGFRYGKTLLAALGVAGKNVVLEKDVTGGAVDLSGTPKAGEDVTLTVTPDTGKILSSFIVNGVQMVTLVPKNGILTLEKCTAETLNIEAVFIEPVPITAALNFAAGNNANGMQVRLVKEGTVVDTVTVAEGKAVFENLLQGSYRAQINLYGYWADLGDALYTLTNSQSFDVADIFSDKNRVDLDGNTEYVNGSGNAFYSIASSITGEAWFATKVKADKSTFGNKIYRIGFVLRFGDSGDNECSMTLVHWDDGHWSLQTCGKWFWESNTIPADCQEAIWGDGMYFVVRRDVNGLLYCYYGTCLEDIAIETRSEHWAMDLNFQKQAITTFGVGYWGTENAPYTASFSGFRYGTTLLEAFGIEKNDPITVTGAGAQDHGTVTVTENAKRGDDVTITLTPTDADNYKIGTLKVNGKSVNVTTLADGTYTLKNYLGKTLAIEATFVEIVRADVTVSVNGKKLGIEGNAAIGLEATLSDGTYTYKGTVAENGTAEFKQVVTGEGYSLSIVGFLSATGIEVTENGIADEITLEYDTFDKRLNWGSFDWSHVNDADAKVVASNGSQMVMTKDTYEDVAFTLYLGGANRQGGNQAIYFLFGTQVVSVRAEGRKKIQFTKDLEWVVNHNDKLGEEYSVAPSADYQDLIFFDKDVLEAYEAGTLKLTVARRGGTFYVFLDDAFIGKREFSEFAAAGTKASVGICWIGLSDGVNKDWNIELTTDLSALISVTADENGTAELSKENAKAGDQVSITLTPKAGKMLKRLTVGGIDVTKSVAFDKETLVGTYSFTAPAAKVSVVAEFGEIAYGAQSVGITGGGYKANPVALADGAQVTLTGAMAEYTLTVTEGKLDFSTVMEGVYVLSTDGFLSAKITVAADMADIKLVTPMFTDTPDSADFTEAHLGKVMATGNGSIDLTTKEKYTDFTAEAHFDVLDYNSRRYSVSLVFADGKNFRIDFAVQDGSSNILQQTNWGSIMFNWEWVDFPEGYFAEKGNNYTEDEIINTFIANGLDYKLEREGATVKLYINGVLMKTYTLPDSYATQEVQIRFIQDSNGTDGTKGFTFDITVPDADAE